MEKPTAPLLQALRDHPLCRPGVVAGQRHVAEPENLETDGPVRHEIGGVDGDPAVVVAAESGDRIHRQAGDRVAQQAGKPAPVGEMVGRGQGGEGHSVQAHDLGGDPLAQPVGVLRIGEQVPFRVGVGVDEAGGNRQTAGIDGARRLCLGEIADFLDALAADADVRTPAGIPGSVVHGTAADYDVEHDPLRMKSSCDRLSRRSVRRLHDAILPVSHSPVPTTGLT